MTVVQGANAYNAYVEGKIANLRHKPFSDRTYSLRSDWTDLSPRLFFLQHQHRTKFEYAFGLFQTLAALCYRALVLVS